MVILFGVLIRTELDGNTVGNQITFGFDTHQKWTTPSRTHAFAGKLFRFEAASEGTLQLLNGFLHQFAESVLRVDAMQVFDQFSNDLGVRVGLELVALVLQKHLDVLVVGQDAVVHHDELVVISRTVRVRVDFGGDAVSGPASMSDSAVHMMGTFQIQAGSSVIDFFLQGLDFAFFLDETDAQIRLVFIDANAYFSKVNLSFWGLSL